MTYAYLLRSVRHPGQRCVGLTSDLQRRSDGHNSGKCHHTRRHRPWKIAVAIRFEDDARAIDFERYLKSGSGRAFANRRFW